ncbi:BlaI/MecI/CopY family transcriptional regulator [Algoriphagus sp. C2-6-M1]|uniref:BlaI/MecI/CopY family transcriptional regulator n=1 Tax=Algoriphagus TaxID=246875 RepID=UPI002B3E01FB|nr:MULTISPECIES: BlaI/MecI/CopY family transcriptional regulator [unclassified Algoriphagus]MEB2777191.1 BlaI/MecI/CopY family transcriptional regulator [Algoriphagus sp. D3-2-R+10]MEB2782855.1 BlaI/MecI/CopY family transcriptional regulator [Algoriphagus sp. C2-6-M1]
MEELTAYEEQIMKIFWKLNRAIVRDVLHEIPDPKPPYTTLASTVKVLEKKGYLGHKSYGKTNEYYTLIAENDYRKKSFNHLVKNFFGGSVENVLSYLVKEKKVSEKDIQEMHNLINSYEKNNKS